MIEKDNIQELFSKAFENQTAPVKPDLWAGVQAKMAAAGVASTATVATKGLSALTKWIIGSAAVGTVGVVTAVVALNSGEERTSKQTDAPKEIAQNTTVTSTEEKPTKEKTWAPHTGGYIAPVVIDEETFGNSNPKDVSKEKEINKDVVIAKEGITQIPKTDKQIIEKTTPADNSKKDGTEKTDSKKAVPADTKKEMPAVKHPENIAEPVFADLKAEVTDFPNIFTPNGDGINDFYKVTVSNIEDFNLIIISNTSNSNTIFKTNDPNEGWDGTISGDRAPDGMYAAVVTGKDKNGKRFKDIQLFELKR